MTKYKIPFVLSILACFFQTENCWGQCTYYQLFHLSGTESAGGCTDVTATPEGSTSTATYCGNYSPYWIGDVGPGAYLFEFSNPVSSARISLTALDHNTNPVYREEVVSFEIDGAPYPLTNAGTYPPGCFGNTLFINSDGNIASTDPGPGSWEDIVITEPMNSLKISDLWLGGSPIGVVFRIEICCAPINCTTDAGMLTAAPLELCEDEMATISPPVQTFLESDDLLEYILFSNPTDTLGSIIATSLTPEFSFDSGTMLTGVTYYIAAIAGNDAGGNVDLNDPCLDISNAVEVIWHPLPAVSFLSLNSDLCVDECIDIVVTFTGSPPFQLTAEVLIGTTVIETIDETYNSNLAILPLCVPSGTPTGEVTLTATGLVDNFCTCN